MKRLLSVLEVPDVFGKLGLVSFAAVPEGCLMVSIPFFEVRHKFPLLFLLQLLLGTPRFLLHNFLGVGISVYFCSYTCVVVVRVQL